VLVEGIVAFVVGLYVLVQPQQAGVWLGQLIGAYFLVNSGLGIYAGFSGSGVPGEQPFRLVAGGIGLVTGLIALAQPLLDTIDTQVAITALGVPYAILLSVWVSITSIILYLGVFLGAIPAVILALFESSTTAVLTALVFLFIQQLESNILTPKIQGQTLRIPSVVIFLAVILGRDREPPRRHLRRADRRRVKGTPRLLPRSTAHQE
jgi:hypothetical protein